MKNLAIVLLFSLFASISSLMADDCYSEKLQKYIVKGMQPGEAFHLARTECQTYQESIISDEEKLHQYNFNKCLAEKQHQLNWQGKHPQDSYMLAVDYCRRVDANYQYDPRPTTTNFLYTLFMNVGIFRDQAIPRAYEIVYAPGGKGPKNSEEVKAKIDADVEQGFSFYESVRRLFQYGWN